MLVKMKREIYNSLDDTMLRSACFDPMIKEYKNNMQEQTLGNEVEFKLQFYKQLTNGQQALFMFNAYYNHASKSLAEFYWWSAYYFAQPKVWSEIKVSLQYFRVDAMIRLLDKMEGILEARNYPKSLARFDASHNDLDEDSELFASVSPINATFKEISSAILMSISENIRINPDEFIRFED